MITTTTKLPKKLKIVDTVDKVCDNITQLQKSIDVIIDTTIKQTLQQQSLVK